MKVLEQYSQAKHSATPSEDQVALNASVAAVIDGATPKTAFRLSDGESPGHFAARILKDSIEHGIADPALLSQSLHIAWHNAIEQYERNNNYRLDATLMKASIPTASLVIYDEERHLIIQIGDAPFAVKSKKGIWTEYRNEKRIDLVLSNWRSSILHSMLSRGIITPEQIRADDPARRIIQPYITRQTIFQNTSGLKYSFGVMDGQTIPVEHIHLYPIGPDIEEIILASDGMPRLFPTLVQSLAYLQQALNQDPLCIDVLRGTKGLRPGATWPDDVSYLRIAID